MPLTQEQLQQAVDEHMRAERERDLDFLDHQLDPEVEYIIKTVSNPDDPTPYGTFTGSETYLNMWRRLYTIFESYEIEIEDTVLDVSRGVAWVRLQITAVPVEEWNGLPAGRPVRWWPAAVCVFDDDGHMLSETVYGSFPPIMDGYRRALEFNASEASD